MASQTFELGILIALKDAASRRVGDVTFRLREMGKEGKVALKSWDDLQRSMGKGFAMAGIGIAGLATMRSGIKTAADFESAMLNLKSAFQEVDRDGTVNVQKLGDQMNRAELLAVNLGNKLQGSTQDYLEIMTALKQAGVDQEVILGGAARAAGHLANVTGAMTKGTFREQAKELGQFGKMFNLKPEEFEAQVNLFSALRDRFDIESSELIDSSKYFLTTAKSIGQTGSSGAADVVKVFALLKRAGGIEGTTAGTSLTSMFQQYIASRKELEKLSKATGVKLELFDGKSREFAGWENLFKQAEKLRALPDQTRLEFLNKAFGEQGAKAFGVFMEAGVAGWAAIGAEAGKAVPVNDKITAQMATYNAKLEAVKGSWDNLKATTFTPLLSSLKPVLDTTNSIIGATQGWAKEHQTITGIATHLFGVASAGLVVVGGVKSMVAAWRIWKLVTAIGAGEAGLLSFLRRTKIETDAAGTSATVATRKVGGLRGSLSRLPSFVKIGIAAVGIEYALSRILDVIAEMRNLKQAQDDLAGSAATGEKVDAMGRKAVADLRAAGKTKEADELAKRLSAGASSPGSKAEQAMRQLKNAGAGSLFGLAIPGADFSPAGVKKFAPSLNQSDVMTEFLRKLRAGSFPMEKRSRETLESSLRTVFPDSFKQATEGLEQSLKQAKPEVNQTSQEVKSLGESSRLAASRLMFLAGLVGLGPGNQGGPLLTVPSRASGGFIERSGLAMIHAGETIVPARVTPRFEAPRLRGAAGAGNVTVHLHVHPAASSAMANDPQAFAKQALEFITHEVRKQRERR